MTKATHDISSSFNSTQSFEPSRKANSSRVHTPRTPSVPDTKTAPLIRGAAKTRAVFMSCTQNKDLSCTEITERNHAKTSARQAELETTGQLPQVNSARRSSSPSLASTEQLLLLTILMCTRPISYTNKSTVCENVNTGTSTFKEISQELC